MQRPSTSQALTVTNPTLVNPPVSQIRRQIFAPPEFSSNLSPDFNESISGDLRHSRCTVVILMNSLSAGIRRRIHRTQRRRKIGRAYDMALEVARLLPKYAQVLDVGCGNGFIGHHLHGLLNARVVGIDLGVTTSSNIEYLAYDGRHFPVNDHTFDAVLLCYVLHHAQDARLVLNEVSRVLRRRGLAVVYEDIPEGWFDRVVCWVHNRQWRGRTGPCNFQLCQGWKETFNSAGFEILLEKPLSRWRNVAHPVSRQFYLLRATDDPLLNRTSERTSTSSYITDEILASA